MLKMEPNLKLAAVAAGSLLLTALVSGAGTVATWNFNQSDAGWTTTAGAFANDGAGIEPADNAGNRAHDAAHDVAVLTSPIINFSTVDAVDPVIDILWEGGQGNQAGSPDPTNLGVVTGYNNGRTNNVGQKGLGFRNLATGNYDFVSYDSENGGGVETLSYTRGDLIAGGIDPNANYVLDFFTTDDGGWGWTRLNEVNLDPNAFAEPELGPIIFWDFGDGPGEDHSWVVLNGFAGFAQDGIHASTDGTDFAGDDPHQTFVLQSPIVNFSNANEEAAVVEVDFIGGAGNQGGSPDPADPAAVLAFNGGNSASNGQKGLAFLNVETETYDYIVYNPAGGGNPETISLSKDDLVAAGIDVNADHRLHFFDNDNGAGGWTRLESVNLDAVVLPEPPPPGATSITWSFNQSDAGWTTTAGAFANDGGGIEPADDNGARAHDAGHAVAVLTSPTLNFVNSTTTGTVLEIDWEGGQGNQNGSPDPANLEAVTGYNGGRTNGDGQKGLGLRNLATGDYDFVSYDSENGGGIETLTYTRAQLVAGGIDPNANYQMDFFTTDDGGWGWTRLNEVRVNAETSEPDFTTVWDFNDEADGDNSWKVENGFVSFASDGVHASTDGNDFAEDSQHETLIFRSPTIDFATSPTDRPVIEVDFVGGQGNQSGSPDPTDPADLLLQNGGNSKSTGQKAIAFLNLTTGNYDLVLYDSEDGGDNPETIEFTRAELTAAGIDTSQRYRLDFVDNDDGTAGWTRLESVSLNAQVIPDAPPPPPPPPLPLSGLWDFSTGDLQGWTVVSGSAAFDGNGVEAADRTGARAHDANHEVFVMTSPAISFRGTSPDANAVEIDWEGGQGNQDGLVDPANLEAVLNYNGGSTNGGGQKGLGFRNLATGDYDFVAYDTENGGGVETQTFTLDDLVNDGIDANANYELDFFTTDDGGWGWTRLNAVRLDAILNPGPTSVPQLRISQSAGNLVIEWDSLAGMVYNLRSETDPSAALPLEWPIYDGNENIPATPDVNILTIPLPADGKRFFVIEEFPAPPLTLFSDDLENGPGNWTTIVNDPTGDTQWELGTPASDSGPTSGAGGSANAWSTNLGNYGPNSDISLRTIAIDMSGAASAVLRFDAFRDGDTFGESAGVRFLRKEGENFVQLGQEALIDMADFDTDYKEQTIPVDPAAIGQSEVYIEFNFVSDDTFDAFSGLTIDNITVTDK